MARGKVGGTSSRKVGALGTVYTQVKKTASGTYITYTYEKPTSRLYTNTPAQAKARLITAVIERPMKALKSMLRWTFQGADNTTAAVNIFSKLNRRLVEEDYENNFSGWSQFTYPDKYSPNLCIGPYIISSGTLHYDIMRDAGRWSSFKLQQLGLRVGTDECWGVQLNKGRRNATVAQFLKKAQLSEGTRFFFCAFLYDQETQLGSWAYLNCRVLPYLHKNDVVTDAVLTQLIKVSANCRYYLFCGNDGQVYLGIRLGEQEINKEVWYYGTAFGTQKSGRWMCSNTRMISADPYHPGTSHPNNPASVWNDWLNNNVE